MPTTLGAADPHSRGQLEGVDDAAGAGEAVDEPLDESDDPDDFSDEPDFFEEPDFSDAPEPLVAEPDVTAEPEPERESVR